ncbi:peptidoglycan -binding protein [Benzoatithermus flavus]|uniref:Peptidoglycan -binding protein n=1 Tax=Benzoatithermus flavus TaxID=3108223 RepID=A0ABU8XMX4_9PROT
MARTRREGRHVVDIWPGFVDALSTLILSIIFLLVVFVLAQFFLGQLLQGRNEAVRRLEGQVQDLTSKLGLEQDAAAELRRTLARINADLQQAFLDRDELSADLNESEQARAQLSEQVSNLTREQALLQRTLEEMRLEQSKAQARAADLERELSAARESVKTSKEQMEVQLGQLVQLRRDIEALQKVRADLEGRVAELSTNLSATDEERRRLLEELGTTRDRSKALEAKLEDANDRTMLAQKEIQARDLRIEELLRSSKELENRLGGETSAKEEAVQQVQALTEQIRTLSQQLAQLEKALDIKQSQIDQQKATIENLGQRLNMALASKVEELSQYRSEFFGRLRQALGNREDIRAVGDRFVFQSEVLFNSGSAEIEPRGRDELAKIATALKEIMAEIPPDLPWVLQVDGHTDKIPISTPRFPSNWELSTARAIAVAQFLIGQGVPADRVAARGFAEFQPLDPGDSPEAYRRNRRIEIKLTTR